MYKIEWIKLLHSDMSDVTRHTTLDIRFNDGDARGMKMMLNGVSIGLVGVTECGGAGVMSLRSLEI